MGTEPVSQSDAVLSPSEVVMLHGDQFCKKPGWGEATIDLPDGKTKVNPLHLAPLVVAAVVLANEHAGTIRLQVQEKKGFLGRRTRTLLAEAGEAVVNWPAQTLESQVRPLADAGPREVSDLTAALLQEKTSSGWCHAVTLVQNGLMARGLLETGKLLSDHTVASVKRLLDDCQRNRPELWKLLTGSIGEGLHRRTEHDDSSPQDYSPPD